MRIRAKVAATVTAAALSAALAVTALAAPAVGADQDDSASTFTNIDVNHDWNGYTVGVEAAKKRLFSVSATISDPSGVKSAKFELWHGEEREKADGVMTAGATCHRINALTAYCEALLLADPKVNIHSNALAGIWYLDIIATDGDGNVTRGEGLEHAYFARVKRPTYMSQTDATPEPVKKGQNLNVKAQMTVASWETNKNVPLVGHQVLLQYRKGTSGPFVTLKKVKTDRNGWATATVKATADGAYRYDFAGTNLTLAAAGFTDYVDVK
ncbi:hypothetical protein ACKI1I_13650 [Streptomyces turgidiscabies]|uniref:Calcium-binding protein n=1 Tax=Streptomyces turgidiscabies (strain Car8) TaxID=698760 RepID=L7F8F8_STRT8|nr:MULTISPECIES: hypothetical protein [Streptomyces]ELP67321.1 hypothetical protein STRTUCAR8_06064 [Streptomyces turgidiscabies Car8]MDX3492923.1 hypothetical protein [Streptomyces turgidiscabies]GAQ74295.1 hypothetical protein T45_06067 [Streptomyces turgidiscabies]